MQIHVELPLDPIEVPAGWTVGHATRINSAWAASIENLYAPPYRDAPRTVTVRTFEGSTAELGRVPLGRNPLRRRRARGQRQRVEGRLIVDTRRDADGNIAHVLTKQVARALLAREQLAAHGHPDVPITAVIRERAADLAERAYALMGFEVLRTDGAVEGLVLDEFKQGHLYEWTDRLFDLDFPGQTDDTPAKLYIARRGVRSVANDDRDIWPLLRERGYERVYFEDHPLARQWSMLRHAERVVAVHGAALGALVFKAGRRGPDNFSLVEIFGPGYTVHMYRHLAAVLGGRWSATRGRVTADIVRALDDQQKARARQTASIEVDPRALELALEPQKITEPRVYG
ncbi:MAG: glycosyltransferase family 61 protein [Planctomycetota bacterium]